MATKTLKKISLRVYPVGFGDCFLLGFHYAGDDNRFVLVDFGSTALTKKRVPRSRAFMDYMNKVADDIAGRCGRKNGKGGQLHAIIATHRHADHINGFARKKDGKGSGDIIRTLKPDVVIQPWTEDPDAEKDATSATPAHDPGSAALRALSNMQTYAQNVLQESEELKKFRIGERRLAQINFQNAGYVIQSSDYAVYGGVWSRHVHLLPPAEGSGSGISSCRFCTMMNGGWSQPEYYARVVKIPVACKKFPDLRLKFPCYIR